jgi:flagellar hook-length control protein FliK
VITAAAAPAVLDAAPATASATAETASSGVFDAILALQGFAGTTDTFDAGAFEAGDTSDALAADDLDDEDSDEDIDPSLAFLADLIAAASAQSASNGASNSGGSSAGNGGTAQDDALTLAATLDADAGVVLAGTDKGGKADLLQGLATVLSEPQEKRPASGDASQNLARAVELMSQPRAAAAEAARPAVLTHARDPRWADDFSARVSLMVRAGESTASLAMTPVDLGPVEVNVTVKDSQATIQFAATQADTRALIEASLPKLRELLASQGFNLLDASVSSGFSRSQQSAFASTTRGGANGESETSTAEAHVIRQLGLLDTYA